ncbi:MAG: hypothetical protein ACFFBD_29150 [Candidatus Hodarchaeota archaeon]
MVLLSEISQAVPLTSSRGWIYQALLEWYYCALNTATHHGWHVHHGQNVF